MPKIQYGKRILAYSVKRSSRKSLEIAVLPDQSIEVSAPKNCSDQAIAIKVKKRLPWIVKQQHWFQKLGPTTPARQFLGGESHLYLGRQYRLKLTEGDKDQVKLVAGYFQIQCAEGCHPDHVAKLLNQWIRDKAKNLLTQTLKDLASQYAVKPMPTLQLREMKTQWGSLSKKGLMTLNPQLIKAPKKCIEYVITHELCHTRHHDHSPAFYKLLQKKMPDWEKRKQRLEEITR